MTRRDDSIRTSSEHGPANRHVLLYGLIGGLLIALLSNT